MTPLAITLIVLTVLGVAAAGAVWVRKLGRLEAENETLQKNEDAITDADSARRVADSVLPDPSELLQEDPGNSTADT